VKIYVTNAAYTTLFALRHTRVVCITLGFPTCHLPVIIYDRICQCHGSHIHSWDVSLRHTRPASVTQSGLYFWRNVCVTSSLWHLVSSGLRLAVSESQECWQKLVENSNLFSAYIRNVQIFASDQNSTW